MFTYKEGRLHAEDCAVENLVAQYGSPLFIYSRGHFLAQYQALKDALAPLDPMLCYSAKVNTNQAVLRTFACAGAGVDIVSGGELHRALRAGFAPDKIVFAGVGKTEPEIEQALQSRILFFTVESEGELERIAACAEQLGIKGRIAIRVNPDVDPQTHIYTSTGKKENKFGLDLERARAAYQRADACASLEIAGLHMHIGSQILTAEPWGQALEKVRDLCREMKAVHPSFRFLDIGGGLGIRYEPEERDMELSVFHETIEPIVRELDLKLLMEPGRFLVGNGGILACRVQYVKDGPDKKFVIVDTGMNELIRPPLYQAFHDLIPVHETAERVFGDVVGPICESGDFICKDRELPAAAPGDLLAVCSAGAYCYSMASNYNSRPRPAEVMVSGAQHALVRERETYEDLVRGERVASFK